MTIPTPGQGSDNVTERAIDAATQALYGAYGLTGSDAYDAASDALRVAVPILLADVADQIEAKGIREYPGMSDYAKAANGGLLAAAVIVRSAAAGWFK